ncbi:MAG: YicC family protein [Bacteroidales bacterium]|nr:YicC family protein [Bacteroidales bacterium]
MIRSMTGFGKASADIPGKKINIEIRTLNSKQTDINAKMPWIYREKEIEIREILTRTLERGKIDLSIYTDEAISQNIPVINSTAVHGYYKQLKEIAGELCIDADDQLLSIIMRLPEILKTEKEVLAADEWNSLKKLITEAAGITDAYRRSEGLALARDMEERIGTILSMMIEIEPFEESRIDNLRERIHGNLVRLGTENVDMNRLEQELIYYLEKLDITEEKVRLKQHCGYFLETMNLEGANGRKLGFIAQEIGREINTIGSKANNATIQGIVVRMKDELEKIREQVLNIL